MQNGEFILYQLEDGNTKIDVRVDGKNVWLTQKRIAELFGVDRSVVTKHLKNIFNEKELTENSVCANFAHTAEDGKSYNTLFYSLEAILSVGYRVHSSKGIQFRQWATNVLKEYLIKGFAMDDDRLKQSEKWDYFDEWLARIRDIRASEKRFYQKIRDLYATAIDYDKTSEEAQLFFSKVQNKMLWAVTGNTAAELIAQRSAIAKSNMGLTSWKGSIVRKADVTIAKNYLQKSEIEKLNRIVTMYIDYAEDQAEKRKAITMKEWSEKLDAFLKFNDHEILHDSGKIQMVVAKKLAEDRYERFEAKRTHDEAILEDNNDLKEIEEYFNENLLSKKE